MTLLARRLCVRDDALAHYGDVITPKALETLDALADLNTERRELMHARQARRLSRAKNRERITFLPPATLIRGIELTAEAARAGHFAGSPIPHDLTRQWIQGTGPATRPRAPTEAGLRNVAYALLSGADGWMFDGEDALGQLSTMSLDNQRNLKLAFAKDPLFLKVCGEVATEMNAWAQETLGRTIVEEVQGQLQKTTRIFRARGLHLDDRHVRESDGYGFSASITDSVLYVVNNLASLQASGSSVVLYLPKIQTANEASFWHTLLTRLELHLGMAPSSIRTYVLIEQLEASFQLMEIRAALGRRFVGFNTGRWDYINSVSDALAWDETFVSPNIDAITMTYGYMKNYEDRVRRAVNTPDENGLFALWQGGMEPNIPVGSKNGVADGMKRAVGGAEREQKAGASGKWVAHWKMVHIVRPVWEKVGEDNQMGRSFPPLTYTDEDSSRLTELSPAPRTMRGARDLLSVALQYGNAFEQGFQAAALKPADFFGNDDVLYLMEDMATGEIRLSILWEWLHKGAALSEDDKASGLKTGDVFSKETFARLLEDEYTKLLHASNRDVHDDSKATTLPIARAVVLRYLENDVKPPWYIDLLNLNLDHASLPLARERIQAYLAALEKDGTRLTDNPDSR